MNFKYKGINKDGSFVENNISAISLLEAKKILKEKNIYYSEIIELKEYNYFNFFKKEIKNELLYSFSRELSMYLSSGNTLLKSLNIIKQNYKNNKKMNNFFEYLIYELKDGSTFYNSLKNQKEYKISNYYLETIKISEENGILPEVLLELSKFLKKQDSLDKEIKTALTYPIFMFFISFFMISFMLTFIVPEITKVFNNNNQKLPDSTQFVIFMGDFFSSYYIFIFLFIFISLLSYFLLLKNKKFKFLKDTFILKIPFFGNLILKSELIRFSYIISLLSKSSMNYSAIINLSNKTFKNLKLKNIFEEASKEVIEGKNFSLALKNKSENIINKNFIQNIILAEETSELEKVYTNIHELYLEENSDKIKKFLVLLEPILMLIVGSSVGFIVISMLLPIFTMSVK
jgi:general secretion pathway protein F/type IV pilus assembly protein PilC